MITDVNQQRFSRFASQSPWKQNELVDVAEPLPQEGATELHSAKLRFGLYELSRHARGCKPQQHHHRESLHALLPISRVVTDQQNHSFGRPFDVTVRRTGNAGALGL